MYRHADRVAPRAIVGGASRRFYAGGAARGSVGGRSLRGLVIGGAPRRWADRSGFTLIEALVAFTVMAIVLGVLFRGVVQTRAGANVFAARTQEEVVTRSLIADFRARRDLLDGSYAGTRDGRRWTLKASAMDLTEQLPRGDKKLGADPVAAGSTDAASASNAGVSGPGGPSPATGRPQPLKPVWVAQRLVLRVATGARPLETEVVHLVKLAPSDAGDAR